MNDVRDFFYSKLSEFLLSRDNLQKFGFPYINEQTSTVNINQCSYFSSQDIKKQVCRCKRMLSLLEENWFLGDVCQYHPLKLTKGHSKVYKCCGKRPEEPGCVISPVHTCSYFSLEGDWFKLNPSAIEKHYAEYTIMNIFALDCEFVYTVSGMEVARVSLVSMGLGVIYDEFVIPDSPILDYNTRFSGIRHEDLTQQYVKSLCDVQSDLLKILNCNSILIGHSLHSDLIALHFIHDKIVDTSVLFPHYKGFPYRNSLQYLAMKHLRLVIHEKETGHDSVEDAEICIQLVSLRSELPTYNNSRMSFPHLQMNLY